MRFPIYAGAFLCIAPAFAQNIAVDSSGVRPGPVRVESAAALRVEWPDERGRTWTAQFDLDPRRPLIQSISVGGKPVIAAATPFYSGQTGRRRGGFDAFFDFPSSAPEGTRNFLGEFHPKNAHVK